MAEYIERKAIIAEIVAEAEKEGKKSYDMAERGCDDLSAKYTHGEYCYNVAEYIVKTAPTADVEPVVHSSWELVKTGDDIFDYYFRCKHCRKNTPDKAFAVSPDFCPYCGAKMDGKEVQE